MTTFVLDHQSPIDMGTAFLEQRPYPLRNFGGRHSKYEPDFGWFEMRDGGWKPPSRQSVRGEVFFFLSDAKKRNRRGEVVRFAPRTHHVNQVVACMKEYLCFADTPMRVFIDRCTFEGGFVSSENFVQAFNRFRELEYGFARPLDPGTVKREMRSEMSIRYEHLDARGPGYFELSLNDEGQRLCEAGATSRQSGGK